MPMVKTGTITGREVRKNRDGTGNRLMLQVEMSNPDDIQTVEYVSLPGQDENPINGSRVYVFEVGPSYKIGIAVNDGIEPGMNTGEKRMYALNDAGAIQSFINLLKTGIIEINGNGDFAVRFQALQDKLTLLEAQLIAHVHPGVTAGGASTGVSVTPFDIDISTAKVNEVKLPS